MLTLLVLTLCLLSNATADKRALLEQPSAASRSQIMYAIENNFDDTGPGAMRRENAYKTFNTLEDALVNYLNDPDTVLPEFEKKVAVKQLMRAEKHSRPIPKLIGKHTIYNERQKFIDFRSPLTDHVVLKNFYKPDEPGRLQKYQPVNEKPMNLAYYVRDPHVSESQEDFNHHPQYSFSYGVHDKNTGDSKSAHETRDGGVVKGYYTFMDADGQQRTVRYTADDERGFRATVQRTQTNSQ